MAIRFWKKVKAKLKQGFRPQLGTLELEDRITLDATIFQDKGIIVTVRTDALAAARPIGVQRNGLAAASGDQIVISYASDFPIFSDYREALVLDTNGFMRLRHLDSNVSAGLEDPFGTSFKLAPLLVTAGPNGPLFFLSTRVDTINLLTDEIESDILKLRITGRPADGPSANNPNVLPIAVQWDLRIPRPNNDETGIRLATRATFEQAVVLSQPHVQNAEAFRAAEFSSSNVDASNTNLGVRSRDADQLRTTSSTGAVLQSINLDTTTRNQLIFTNGSVFDGALEVNQNIPAPLNDDPPNNRVHFVPDSEEYRAQGFVTLNPTINQDSDNVGIWASRTLPSPTIAAGTILNWAAKYQASESPEIYFNHDPIIEPTADVTLNLGTSLDRVSLLRELDSTDLSTVTVDYGDNTGTQVLTISAGKTFRLLHSYAQIGTYTVTVIATDDENGVGRDVFQVQVNPTPPPVIAAPAGLTASLSGSGVILRWSDRAVNEASYLVERSSNNGANWTTIAPVLLANTTGYIDNTAGPGSHLYRVFACNAELCSAPSNTASIRILPSATVQFSQARYTVKETNGRATIAITLTRNGNLNRTFQVRFAALAGTATAGTDFRPVSTIVRFARNQARQTVLIPIIKDRIAESEETVQLFLSQPSGNVKLGTLSTAELVIR